jgi:porin
MKIIFLFVATIFLAPLSYAYDLIESPYLFGDWGGSRTSLNDHGISFTLGYGSEIAHNSTGGKDIYTAYTDQWVFGASFDFEKMGEWKGGSARIMITNRNGENLNDVAQLGNDMLVQEVYGRGQTWHLTQFWYEQKLFGDVLQWKIGRMTVGEDFATFSCDFQNLSFCGSQPGNIVGTYWLNWPTSVWATRFKVQATDAMFWQVGAYQVNPIYVDDSYARQDGLSLDNPGGTTGALIPLEFEWKPKLNGKPGSYVIGVWYNTSKGNDLFDDVNHDSQGLTGLPAYQHGGQYGGYLAFVQQLSGTEADPGWFVFLNIAQADQQTAAQDRQISVGGQYHGIFGRKLDSVGIGLACTDNNPRLAAYVHDYNVQHGTTKIAGDQCEYDSEVYYSYSPITSLYLRPNLQYVAQPGGTTDNPNILVLGLKSGVAF